MDRPNVTINFLAGVDGVKYYNLLNGATNTIELLQFFQEASNAADLNTGRPALEVDDTIIVDTLPAHHGQAERALREFLEEMSIELVYLPVYSPDLDPVDEAFLKLKYLLKYRYQHIVHWNLELALLHALYDITPNDLMGHYRHTGYLNV